MGRKAAKAETKAPSKDPAPPAEAAVKAPAKEEKAEMSKAAVKAPAKEGKAEVNKAEKKSKKEENGKNEEKGILHYLRPKGHVIFFFTFVLLCPSIVIWSEPCGVDGKRKDCGYQGISVTECRAASCFLRGKSGTFKKTVKVKREEGSTLGLVFHAGENIVKEVIVEGAVDKYNAMLSNTSEELIRPGDEVKKIDGAAGGTAMTEAKTSTKSRTVELEIQRLRIPSFLASMQNTKGKPNMMERLLTSSGSEYFAQTWWYFAKIALPCWYCSGFHFASLPLYMSITTGVSWHLARCCHNSNVKAGEPHCYRSKRDPMQTILEQVRDNMMELFGRVKEDPKAYFDWAFMPEK